MDSITLLIGDHSCSETMTLTPMLHDTHARFGFKMVIAHLSNHCHDVNERLLRCRGQDGALMCQHLKSRQLALPLGRCDADAVLPLASPWAARCTYARCRVQSLVCKSIRTERKRKIGVCKSCKLLGGLLLVEGHTNL